MTTLPEGPRNPAPYVVMAFGAATTILVGYGLSVGWLFPSSVDREIAIEILRDIIQVDGVLIGFVGLVTIFAMAELTKAFEGVSMTIDGLKAFPEDKRNEVFGAILRGLSRLLDRRWVIALTVGIIIALLVASILSSLVSMSRLGICVGPQTFILPVCTMISGIVGIFLIFVYAVMQAKP